MEGPPTELAQSKPAFFAKIKKGTDKAKAWIKENGQMICLWLLLFGSIALLVISCVQFNESGLWILGILAGGAGTLVLGYYTNFFVYLVIAALLPLGLVMQT